MMAKLSQPQFPNSVKEPFNITSPKTPNYNCIAWAYGDDSKWYWPDSTNICYWPSTVPRTESLQSFIGLFSEIGYKVCSDGSLEAEYEKIAIFVNAQNIPTHAARQLRSGFWTSKLGPAVDVTHTILSISGGAYGNVSVFMKRARR